MSPTGRSYELKQCIGEEQYASVWRAAADDGHGHTSYAIKTFNIRGEWRRPEDFQRALDKENELLDAVKELRCPHLPRFEEAFADETLGLYCIVMEHVEGSTLRERM